MEGRGVIDLASAPTPPCQRGDKGLGGKRRSGKGVVYEASAQASSLKPCQATVPISSFLVYQCFINTFCTLLFIFFSLSTSFFLFIISLPPFSVPPSSISSDLFLARTVVWLSNLTSARMGQILRWSCLYLAVNAEREKGGTMHGREESFSSACCRWEGSACQRKPVHLYCLCMCVQMRNGVCVVFAAAPFS